MAEKINAKSSVILSTKPFFRVAWAESSAYIIIFVDSTENFIIASAYFRPRWCMNLEILDII